MSIGGAAIGTFVALLLAGAIHKTFPDHDLTVLLACLVAIGAIVGAVLEWQHDFGKKDRS